MYRLHQCTITLTSAKRGSGRKVQVMAKKGKTMSPWSVGGAWTWNLFTFCPLFPTASLNWISLPCCVVKNLTLLGERSDLCPWLVGGNLQAFEVFYLIQVSLFIWRPWDTPDSLTMWSVVRTLGHVVSNHSQRGWRWSWAVWSWVKTLDTNIWVNLPVGNTLGVLSHIINGKINAIHECTERDNWKLCVWNFPGLCPVHLFPGLF